MIVFVYHEAHEDHEEFTIELHQPLRFKARGRYNLINVLVSFLSLQVALICGVSSNLLQSEGMGSLKDGRVHTGGSGHIGASLLSCTLVFYVHGGEHPYHGEVCYAHWPTMAGEIKYLYRHHHEDWNRTSMSNCCSSVCRRNDQVVLGIPKTLARYGGHSIICLIQTITKKHY